MISQSSRTAHTRPFRSAFGALLLTTTGLATVTLVAPSPASAQSVRGYDIPAGSLADAINSFAEQSGAQILYDAALTKGRSSAGLQGQFGVAEGLSRLLSGSGVTFRQTGANIFTLESVPQVAEGTVQLGTLRVEGAGGASAGRAGAGGESAAERADRPYRTAGSSTYISGERIERFRGTSTGDMLSGTPGVLNADNRNGAALDVNIRGMQGQGRVPVIVDGAQQETTVYRGYSGVVGRSYVDPDFIGEVMVEKGPSSAADGAGVIGGVVRMNTISVDDVLRPGKNLGVRIKGGLNSNSSSVPPFGTLGGLGGTGIFPSDSLPSSFGSPDGMDRPGFLEPTGWAGSIVAGFRSEHVDLVAGYARRTNGNYYAGTHGDVPQPVIVADCGALSDDLTCSQPQPGSTVVGLGPGNRIRAGEEVLNTSQDNASFLLKGTLRLPHDHQIDLSYMRYKSDYGEIMPSQILWNTTGVYQARLNSVEMDSYTARYKWNPVDSDLIGLNVRFWMTDANLTIPYQWLTEEPDSSTANWYGSLNKKVGINAENTSIFSLASGSLLLNYGGSYTYETIEPGDGSADGQRKGNRREFSLFLSGEWSPKNWITFNASIRYSNFKSEDTAPWTETFFPVQHGDQIINFNTSLERAAYIRANPGSSRLPISSETKYGVYRSFDDSGFAPILSATIEPWNGMQFYGKYAEAIRLPSLFEATRGFSAGVASGSDLEAERAKTWEAGVNLLRNDAFAADDRLRFKASYFDNNVDNYITRTDLPESISMMVNIDKARLQGVEISGSYDMGKLFGDLAYTHYTMTQFCVKPGQLRYPETTPDLCYTGGVINSYVLNQLPPKDAVSLTLGGRAFKDRLTAGGRLTHVGRRPVSGTGDMRAASRIINVEWKPYTLLDLFASYKVNASFQIDAAIDNVTDVYYMDALTLGLIPSPGRTFRLSMTARF